MGYRIFNSAGIPVRHEGHRAIHEEIAIGCDGVNHAAMKFAVWYNTGNIVYHADILQGTTIIGRCDGSCEGHGKGEHGFFT